MKRGCVQGKLHPPPKRSAPVDEDEDGYDEPRQMTDAEARAAEREYAKVAVWDTAVGMAQELTFISDLHEHMKAHEHADCRTVKKVEEVLNAQRDDLLHSIVAAADMALTTPRMTGLLAEQQLVLGVVSGVKTDEGASLDQLMTLTPWAISADGLRKALQFLSCDGYIYTTIDENHFKGV
jgi:hypothetical protein